MAAPVATLRRTYMVAAGAVALAAVASWATWHVLKTMNTGRTSGELEVVWLVIFAILAGQALLYYMDRPKKATAEEQVGLDGLFVAVVVPAYNEDPKLLRLCLQSLLDQTRRPHAIHVSDDGSTNSTYDYVQGWFAERCWHYGIICSWSRADNAGKRSAQRDGFEVFPGADIFVTCDSDSQLSPNALHELLLPFANPKVQSVAGVVVATNNRDGIIARITDLWYVTNQLVDRSALSTLGSVMVNSGPIAAYRAAVVLDNLEVYMSETFMGKKVTFSDDSLLTLFALLRGRTVQQSTAVAFSHMPVTVSHHLRQYLRWMRGSTIRSMWRFKYLPVNSVAYWAHAMRWFQVVLSTFALGWVAIHAAVGPYFILVPVAVGTGQTLRYLTVRRSDQALRSQVGIWALTPLAVAWAWLVLRPMRWWGIATCGKVDGWGTRKKVEVKA